MSEAFVTPRRSLRRFTRGNHEALNVIDDWNNANEFIFFGRGGVPAL